MSSNVGSSAGSFFRSAGALLPHGAVVPAASRRGRIVDLSAHVGLFSRQDRLSLIVVDHLDCLVSVRAGQHTSGAVAHSVG